MRRHATVLFASVVVLATRIAVADARSGAVATEHQLAADAGAAALRAGGSVVDAAIAAAAAVCVVHASSCGIGGGGFALVHTQGGDAALDYRETAPAGATPDRYLRDGKPDPTLTRKGGLAVAVPGEVAGWVVLHDRFGKLPLAIDLAPAVRLARDGFRLGDVPHLRTQIERSTDLLRADAGLRAVFLDADGNVPGPEARIVQRDLAATLERVGRRGRRAVDAEAMAIATLVQARGGVLTARDVRDYRPVWREPLVGSFAGRRVVTFPPPGSGGVVLEMLGILAGDDLPALSPGAFAHLLAGAMAQGFADRAAWYGDARVPVHTLLDPERLRRLRARIPPDRVGSPTADLVVDAGTAHVSVVDAQGNAVAMTTTINTTFGSGLMVPGTGMILNDEMDDFALPGQRNAYGLVGGDANAIAPGKRPQSSMSPTIVLDRDRPELVVGGSGGPLIISGVVQAVLGVVALGRDLRAAVDAPRIHDQATPPTLGVEPALPNETRAALEKIGHQLKDIPAAGAVAATGLTPTHTPIAAGDRRKDGGEAFAQ
ncbi:MAG TPA: gamma-glutamyltransferase [Candidatus Eisenbacteria bacterium]|nr:gamma-glutamyltransferase [Candidatus Eisenbacteria bacterium]